MTIFGKLCVAVLAVSLLISQASAGSVEFFFDEALWLARVSELEVFDTGSANVGAAQEVSTFPVAGADLGTTSLTFDLNDTGLARSFVAVSTSGEAFVWGGDGPYSTPGSAPYSDVLWIGDSVSPSNCDWRLDLGDETPTFALAFDLIDNTPDYGPDILTIYSQSGELGSFAPIPETIPTLFVGVVASEPITSLVFDEDVLIDAVGIRRLQFAVPEPATMSLLAMGAVALLKRRNK